MASLLCPAPAIYGREMLTPTMSTSPPALSLGGYFALSCCDIDGILPCLDATNGYIGLLRLRKKDYTASHSSVCEWYAHS